MERFVFTGPVAPPEVQAYFDSISARRLTQDEQEALLSHVRVSGFAAITSVTGISEQVIARAICNYPSKPATRKALEAYLTFDPAQVGTEPPTTGG